MRCMICGREMEEAKTVHCIKRGMMITVCRDHIDGCDCTLRCELAAGLCKIGSEAMGLGEERAMRTDRQSEHAAAAGDGDKRARATK